MNLNEETIVNMKKGLDGAYRSGKLANLRGSSNLVKRGWDRSKNFAKAAWSHPGVRAGSTISLLLLGAAGVAVLIRKAKTKGKKETIAHIRNAVARAGKSNNLTNSDKLKIRSIGNIAIAKIQKNVR